MADAEVQLRYAPVAELRRGFRPAEPARYHFTAEAPAPSQGYTMAAVRQLLDAFDAAGVPPDAQLQWSYPAAFAHWSREEGA